MAVFPTVMEHRKPFTRGNQFDEDPSAIITTFWKFSYRPTWQRSEASDASSERNSTSEVKAGSEREMSWYRSLEQTSIRSCIVMANSMSTHQQISLGGHHQKKKS